MPTPAAIATDVRRLLDSKFPVGDVYSDRYTDVEVSAAVARALRRVQGQLVGRFSASMAETLVLGGPNQAGLVTLPSACLKLVSLSARAGNGVWRLRALPPGQGRVVPGQAIPGLEARWVPHWTPPVSEATPYDFRALQAWEDLIGQQIAATAALDLVTITGTVPEGLQLHSAGLEKDLMALPLRQSWRAITLPNAFPDPQTWEVGFWLTSPTEITLWWCF
jgi:hypothetical protein